MNITSPDDYEPQAAPAIIVHALKKNKRPIGFTAWSTTDEPKRKKKKKRKA